MIRKGEVMCVDVVNIFIVQSKKGTCHVAHVATLYLCECVMYRERRSESRKSEMQKRHFGLSIT